MRVAVRGSLMCVWWATVGNAALDVDLTSPSSIKTAASQVAYNLMSYYKGNESGQTPGILPGPPPAGDYYWWEGGAMWGTMIDYWHMTGDSTYNDEARYALVFQAGSPQNSYMPPNWTASLGNDDQGFWALSALLAAESTFQNPKPDQPQWLALAQAVFNTQAARWDDDFCGGGLRWQIPLSNNGYDYKNSIANAILFNLGARLARYTNNATYAQWATKAWEWTKSVGYIDAQWNVYDGGHVEENCTDINKAQFSYTAAIMIQALGFMYNYTDGSQQWATQLQGLTNRTLNIFFPDGIATEVSCELQDRLTCTTDMLSFKGYVHRFLAQTTQMAAFIKPMVMPVLQTSAEAAVKSCQPGSAACGFRWNTGAYDGNTGAGQQMNALGALLSVLQGLVDPAPAVTNTTGGTSAGNPTAGADPNLESPLGPVTGGDRAGAGFLTTLILACMLSCTWWMNSSLAEHPVEVEGREGER